MKILSSVLALITLVLFSGCDGESSSVSRDTGSIDCAIEIQIAVRVQPYREGDGMNEGEFLVVSSNVFPIRSTGGPGHAICNSDGAVMEIEWSSVQMLQSRKDQHHRFKKRIAFGDFRFELNNQVVRPDGVSHGFGSNPGSLTLTTEFDVTQGPVTFSSGAGRNDHALLVRSRLLAKNKTANPLVIPQMPEVTAENAG